MKLLGIFVVACIALAVMQAAAKILVLVVLAGLAVGLVTRPKEILDGLIGLVCLGLLARYPLVGIPVLGVLALIGLHSKG